MSPMRISIYVLLGFGMTGGMACQDYASLTHDPYYPVYDAYCTVCHGADMEGAAQGPPLLGVAETRDATVAEITAHIAEGNPSQGMPAFSQTLTETEIQQIALLIAERRKGRSMVDFKVQAMPAIPQDAVVSEVHTFRVETIAQGLDPLPYAMAALPDGRFLLTEKMRGLRIIAPDGALSPYIEGTPQAYRDHVTERFTGLRYGIGWLLDVALHPDYADNGWIYLSYGDRCSGCNALSRTDGTDVSMAMLIRGRIVEGAWVDEETIWQADHTTYTTMSDMVIGGRITFDQAGHVFMSLGMKGPTNYAGIQDLTQPYGKIHRMNDDGSVPEDNPFLDVPGAVPTTWTYGHRVPQGLVFNADTGQLWGTEMGPRGGDEVNLLQPGKNYGWPLYSNGLDYDGTPVEYGKELGITFDLADIEQPVVDLTPSPAISNFILYKGDAFPAWRHHMILGSLKAATLYRMVVEGDQIVHTEVLLDQLARIRDVEMGMDGTIYLLLENEAGGQVVRLVPDEDTP